MPRDVPEIGMVIIPAGCVDNLINLKPEARIFWNSRADWSCDGDEIPTFAEYPD